MIRLQGSLLVRKIKGRNGPFCVADLVTDVGEFKVKDALLDQFDEGTYQGEFIVSEFFLASYTAFGRAVTEIRVRLADLHIGDSTDLPAQARRDPVEPDPAEEPLHPPRRADDADLGMPARRASRQKARKSEADEEAADIELFGEELYDKIRAREPLKLDPTIGDRVRFRMQRDRMRELNYQFISKTQWWQPL
ncbi:MAG TPA: DUF3275 family protein [Burkholderiaceae bacterium]|nr:DUF3275 family protein [Burkholderiaceae bacterium]